MTGTGQVFFFPLQMTFGQLVGSSATFHRPNICVLPDIFMRPSIFIQGRLNSVPPLWRLAPATSADEKGAPAPPASGGTGGGDGTGGAGDQGIEREAAALINEAAESSVAGRHLYAGRAYERAAILLEKIRPLLAADIYEEAACCYQKLLPDTGSIDARNCLIAAAKIVEAKDRVRAFTFLERAAGVSAGVSHFWPAAQIMSMMLPLAAKERRYGIIERMAAYAMLGGTWDAHSEEIRKSSPEIYTAAGSLIASDKRFRAGQKSEFHVLRRPVEAVIALIIRNMLQNEQEHDVSGELKERMVMNGAIGGVWREFEDVVRYTYPPLHETLASMDEKDSRFAAALPVELGVQRFKEVVDIFQRINRVDIRLSYGREEDDIALLARGVEVWREKGYLELPGIPEWFRFQTWAVTRGESERTALLVKICSSKDYRRSRDRRKELMWYLDDHMMDGPGMRAFFDIARISSSKKMADNIRRLAIAELLLPGFNMKGIGSQREFEAASEQIMLDLIRQRTDNAAVALRFLNRVKDLHDSGFLRAIMTMYSKYRPFMNTEILLDIALMTYTMDDFERIKHPVREDVEDIPYLSGAQKELILRSAAKDPFPEHVRDLWKRGVSLERVAGNAQGESGFVWDDILRVATDMKPHLFEALGPEPQDLMESLRARGTDMKAEGGEGSAAYFRRKGLEKVLDLFRTLESAAKGGDRGGLRSIVGELRHALAGILQDESRSAQVMADLELIERLVIDDWEKRKIEKAVAYDSSNAVHLILAGVQPENCGSCQNYNGTPRLMVGLLGYLLNSGVRIIRVEDEDQTVLGRAMLRLIYANGQPAIFLERTYYRNARRNSLVDEMILKVAKEKARDMGVSLFTTGVEGRSVNIKVLVPGGISPYEYSDAFGGGVHGDIVENGKVVSISVVEL